MITNLSTTCEHKVFSLRDYMQCSNRKLSGVQLHAIFTKKALSNVLCINTCAFPVEPRVTKITTNPGRVVLHKLAHSRACACTPFLTSSTIIAISVAPSSSELLSFSISLFKSSTLRVSLLSCQ